MQTFALPSRNNIVNSPTACMVYPPNFADAVTKSAYHPWGKTILMVNCAYVQQCCTFPNRNMESKLYQLFSLQIHIKGRIFDDFCKCFLWIKNKRNETGQFRCHAEQCFSYIIPALESELYSNILNNLKIVPVVDKCILRLQWQSSQRQHRVVPQACIRC